MSMGTSPNRNPGLIRYRSRTWNSDLRFALKEYDDSVIRETESKLAPVTFFLRRPRVQNLLKVLNILKLHTKEGLKISNSFFLLNMFGYYNQGGRKTSLLKFPEFSLMNFSFVLAINI